MSDTETKGKCHRKPRVLVDAHVEAEMWQWWSRWQTTPEEHAKRLERAVKDFIDFLRDHRSQDLIALEVVPEYKDLCSACDNEWEPYEEDGHIYCAHCGAEVEVLEGDESK